MPCQNEQEYLEKIISEVPKEYDEILIVSNNSTDNTESIGHRLENENNRFKMLVDNREKNGIGYGYAHMTGINSAQGDIIVCADADGTYPIGDVFEIIEYMDKNDIGFVSCNRYPITSKDVRIPFKLRLGVSILNLETQLLYGYKIKDILSGMWVFRRAIRKELVLTEGDWNLSPQIKINAIKSPKIKFDSYHINQKLRYGNTKQEYFKTGFDHFRWIFNYKFKRRGEKR